MLVLGAIALVGLRPWEDTSLVPAVEVSPGLGVALGESTEVAPAPAPTPGGVAAARVAPVAPAVVPAERVPVSAQEKGSTGPVLAVSPGRVVSHAAPVPVQPAPVAPPSSPPPEAQPIAAVPQPAPESPPAPASVPVRGAGDGSGTPGPGTAAGGGIDPAPSCEGDEYTITVGFETVALAREEQAEAEILVQRFASDGSESEVTLEGDLGAVRALISLLVSEGNCVQVAVEIELIGEGETVPEASELGIDPAELIAAQEPVLP